MGCNDRIGWYYQKASDHSQKYKEGLSCCTDFSAEINSMRVSGKYLLERERLVKDNAWKLDDVDSPGR